jgi:SAM-dependent methyltransferase
MNFEINAKSHSADERFSRRLCPICDCDRGSNLLKQSFSSMTNAMSVTGYDLVVCLNCGFVFADGVPPQKELDTYYREISKYDYQKNLSAECDRDVVRFERIAGILGKQFPDRSTKIVEIGCATGRLLSVLKDSGYSELLGVDPSPSAAEIGFGQYGIQIITGSIFDLKLPPCSCDLVILIGVLEHVRDLGRAVLQIRDLLKTKGKVFIGVPDATSLEQAENAPFQEFSVEHINFFGPISLVNLMGRYGFREVFQSQVPEEVGPHTTTPTLYSLFAKESCVSEAGVSKKDEQSEEEIRNYINKSRKADLIIASKIKDLAESGKPVIVWGTGSHTLRLLAESSLARANIVAFVDSNPHYHGKELHDRLIIAPSELRGRSEAILISSRSFQDEIQSIIRKELSCDNELILLYDFS